LGLAISKRIVERMDGRIAVDTKPGDGTTFSFTVPLAAAPHTDAAEFAAPDLTGTTVLIVAAAEIESALLVDYPLARSLITQDDLAPLAVTRRIVLIRPTERHELPALMAHGFTGYLVKPVRAASLVARLSAEAALDGMPAEVSDAGEPATAGTANGKGLSILVAEDNQINALLTRLGHPPPDHRRQRRSGGGILGGRACGRHAL
jgi:CheY-like chemotaxis protein